MARVTVGAPGLCPKEGECPADKQASQVGGERAKQEGLRRHQTQAGSPQHPPALFPWAHAGPGDCPHPHGSTEDMGKVSGAVVGAQGRGCRTGRGLKANVQIMRIFGKKAHLYNLNL